MEQCRDKMTATLEPQQKDGLKAHWPQQKDGLKAHRPQEKDDLKAKILNILEESEKTG